MTFEFAPLLLNPEFDGVAIGLVLLVVGVTLLALLHTMNDWLTPIISSISNTGGNIFERVLNWAIRKVTDGVKWVVREITHYLSEALAGVEHAVGLFFHDLSRLIDAAYGEVADFAVRTAEAFYELTWETIPRMIWAAVRPVSVLARWAYGHLRQLETLAGLLGFGSVVALVRWLHAAASWVHTAETYVERQGFKSLAGFLSRVKTWLDELTRWQTWVRALGFYDLLSLLSYLHHAIAVTIPQEFGRLERELIDWTKYKAKLLRLLTDAGMAAAVIAALSSLLGFNPFCRNNQNILKKTCGLDSALLELLLAGLLTADLLANVEALAELAQSTLEGMIDVVDTIAAE